MFFINSQVEELKLQCGQFLKKLEVIQMHVFLYFLNHGVNFDSLL
jgi:hypothetical protein